MQIMSEGFGLVSFWMGELSVTSVAHKCGARTTGAMLSQSFGLAMGKLNICKTTDIICNTTDITSATTSQCGKGWALCLQTVQLPATQAPHQGHGPG